MVFSPRVSHYIGDTNFKKNKITKFIGTFTVNAEGLCHLFRSKRIFENIVIGGIYRLQRNQQHACCHKLACDCKKKLRDKLQNKFEKHSQVLGCRWKMQE